MKYFCQFFTKSTGYSGQKNHVAALGRDGCVQLDARLSLASMHAKAVEHANRRVGFRRFSALQIMRGDFRKSKPVGEIFILNGGRE